MACSRRNALMKACGLANPPNHNDSITPWPAEEKRPSTNFGISPLCIQPFICLWQLFKSVLSQARLNKTYYKDIQIHAFYSRVHNICKNISEPPNSQVAIL